jgi:hypothetical protein
LVGRATAIVFRRSDPLNKGILEIGSRGGTTGRHDERDQPLLAAEVTECAKST